MKHARTSMRFLPHGYRLSRTINLEKDKTFQRKMLLLSLALLAGALLVCLALGKLLGKAVLAGLSVSTVGGVLLGLLIWLALLLTAQCVCVLLHEGVHALALKLLCPGALTFGFLPRQLVAFVACYGWYFMRDPYVLVLLAPLCALSPVFLLLALATDGLWCLLFCLLFILNVSGAAGDILLAKALRACPRETCVADISGTRMDIFTKVG